MKLRKVDNKFSLLLAVSPFRCQIWLMLTTKMTKWNFYLRKYDRWKKFSTRREDIENQSKVTTWEFLRSSPRELRNFDLSTRFHSPSTSIFWLRSNSFHRISFLNCRLSFVHSSPIHSLMSLLMTLWWISTAKKEENWIIRTNFRWLAFNERLNNRQWMSEAYWS